MTNLLMMIILVFCHLWAGKTETVEIFSDIMNKNIPAFIVIPDSYSIGNDVFIGPGAHFSASNSEIILGSKILFGPNVTILTGDHNISVLGKYMYDVKEKQLENDQPVIIEDDVWVGAGVTILKGVTIKTGSVIAAGSVVVKNVESYSIVAGVPAKKIKDRFPDSELNKHFKLLNEQK